MPDSAVPDLADAGSAGPDLTGPVSAGPDPTDPVSAGPDLADTVSTGLDTDFDLARNCLLEISSAESIGAPAGSIDEGNGVTTVYFETLLAGYPGWRWTVSIAHVENAPASVLETELTPGDTAVLSPAWVPWVDRLADYTAAQDTAVEDDETNDEIDDDDDDDDVSEDEEDDDDESDESDDDDEDDDFGSDVLHGGDLDGVDIDDLDDIDESDDENLDESDDDDDDELGEDDEPEDEHERSV
ncbi:MAG: DUF3027 domain-containing protein [Actinomycetota bacterium]